MTTKRRKLIVGLVLLAVAALSILGWQIGRSRNALWQIVSTSCIPAAHSGGTGRCAEVALAKEPDSGFVVFKDRNGPLQYLLMPTKRISGIEDPSLLAGSTSHYWADAWRAKRWMEVSNGAPIPRDVVSITLNSAWGRSQNQLHLHVSCVRPDLRSFLRSTPASNSDVWTPIPGGWMGHPYEVRKLIAPTLDGQDLFKDVGKDRAEAMDRQAIAAIGTSFDGREGFWLLRTHVDLTALWLGSIEGDVQDHKCTALRSSS